MSNVQKLKKALKKLATAGSSGLKSSGAKASGAGSAKRKPAQAAKKAAPVKKKSQPVVAVKKTDKGAKKAAPPAPAKKAGAKAPAAHAGSGKGKPVAKTEAKDLQKKKVQVPAPAAKSIGKAEAGKAPAKKAAGSPVQVVIKKSEVEAPTDLAPAAAPEVATAGAPERSAPVAAASAAAIPGVEDKPKAKAKKPREEDLRADVTEDEEIVLTDAEGRRYCRVKDCDQAAVVDTYCRYHYLLFWKNIQNRKKILSEGKLERYIEELTARYPDKYLEMLRKDLRSEKEFMAAIQELEIDDSSVDNEYEDEAQSFLEEVRGMGGESSAREEEDF